MILFVNFENYIKNFHFIIDLLLVLICSIVIFIAARPSKAFFNLIDNNKEIFVKIDHIYDIFMCPKKFLNKRIKLEFIFPFVGMLVVILVRIYINYEEITMGYFYGTGENQKLL